MESPLPNPLPALPGEGTRPATADAILRLVRRGVWSARMARIGLFCLAIAGFMMSGSPSTIPVGMGLLFGTAMAWVLLVARTARNQQDLLRVPGWIESGQFDLADAICVRALGRFSVALRPRVQAIQHLAASRHGQRQINDARRLATAALKFRQPKQAADTLRLIIADTALEADDLIGAHAALATIVQPLPLRDSLKVLELQTDYCVRIGAWPHVGHDLAGKVEMAELLPAESAAAVQAMLALAARKLGQPAWSDWLARRATLLADIPALIRKRPVLSEVFAHSA